MEVKTPRNLERSSIFEPKILLKKANGFLDNVGPNKKIHFGGSVYNYPKNIS
jgi:hypothetical protein